MRLKIRIYWSALFGEVANFSFILPDLYRLVFNFTHPPTPTVTSIVTDYHTHTDTMPLTFLSKFICKMVLFSCLANNKKAPPKLTGLHFNLAITRGRFPQVISASYFTSSKSTSVTSPSSLSSPPPCWPPCCLPPCGPACPPCGPACWPPSACWALYIS